MEEVALAQRQVGQERAQHRAAVPLFFRAGQDAPRELPAGQQDHRHQQARRAQGEARQRVRQHEPLAELHRGQQPQPRAEGHRQGERRHLQAAGERQAAVPHARDAQVRGQQQQVQEQHPQGQG